jgi:protease-4
MKKMKWSVAGAMVGSMLIVPAAWAQFGFGKSASEPSEKIAHFRLGALVETPQEMPPLFGGEVTESLKDFLARLKEARLDQSVKAVVLDLEGARLGFGQLLEVHEALGRFEAVDKDVYIHADSLSTGTYALATSASHLTLTPTGDLWLTGLYGEAPYLRGLLDKMGVVPDFEHCGSHKTAAETITRTGPSPESKEMTNWLLDSLYDSLVKLIADSRGMTPEHARKLIDGGPYTAEEALAAGLIDSVTHRQDFVAGLEEKYGASTKIEVNYAKKEPFGDMPSDPFSAWAYFFEMLTGKSDQAFTEPSVAIVYVEGAIQTGQGESSPLGGPASGAYSTTIRKALDKAAKDDSVKALVLRVDSPGGSALASEIIWDATRRVARKKPFVVSMGNVAGSGGYYVSCGAETIFADPTTITASIGVVGGKLVTTGGWDKLGINWSANQRGARAGIMSSAAPFSDDERAKILEYMNSVYDTFRKRVADGRGSKLTKPLESIAGGRVYTGEQALQLGLVDKMGGLDDAIKFAADRARLGDYEIRVIPKPLGIFDLLFQRQSDEDEYARSATGSTGLVDSPLVKGLLDTLRHLEPDRAAAVMQALICVDLIHREGVVTMMPAQLIVR